jgi:hypothetical protein
MEHARHSRGTCFGYHRACVILGVARVNDNGALELARQRELFGESAALLETGRVVVVIIEAAFADRDGAGGNQLAKSSNIANRIEAGSVVRVDARRMRNEAGIARRQGSGITGSGEDVSVAAAGPDADYRAGPGDTGPLDYLVAVAGERRVGEVRVAVDEVWNAVVLRGHLRSIQRSTGLAT